jgi:dienelactone hydrolase
MPEGREAVGAVVLIGGSGGTEPSYVAEPLAAEGLATLSLAYFGRPALPNELREIPLEYFRDALRLLIAALPSRLVPVAVLGMSRGSEAALLSAIQFKDLVNGLVLTVPGNLVVGSWPPGGPAWMFDGRSLPYVDDSGPAREHPDATIPVELVPGPILMLSAGSDQVWPSASMARAKPDRRRASGHSAGDLHLQYPAAGHSVGYLIPSLPAGLLPAEFEDQPADKAARADAWPKVVEFLRRLPLREVADD